MDYMTVVQLRHRAKTHGLKGISRMRKAELITALESIRHQVGDRVTRYIDGKPGTIVGIQESTFDGVFDSTVQIAYDGEKFEETGTSGAHHSVIFVSRPAAPRTMADRYADGFEFDGRDDVYLRETFDLWSLGDENADWAELYRAGMRAIIDECHTRALEMNKTVKPARKIDRYSHWATSFPLSKYGDGNVCQGHADYCAEFGHATEKSTDLNGVTTVAGHCPRCGDTLKTPEQIISERDTIDQAQMVDVLRQVVDNGRDDLMWVLDRVDAAQCPEPSGQNSTIPRGPVCHRCAESASPCDHCALAWLVSLYHITGDVKLNELPAVAEFDCYA